MENLLDCKSRFSGNVSSVSLQVTLHRENMGSAFSLLKWAEQVGIERIKWNPVVFLNCASQEIRDRFSVPVGDLKQIREKLLSETVRCEGSLFFDNLQGSCVVSGMDCEGKSLQCPFAEEVWVWPDGHEDHCPNPNRRWNDAVYCVKK